MTDVLSFVGGGKRIETQEKKGNHFQPSISLSRTLSISVTIRHFKGRPLKLQEQFLSEHHCAAVGNLLMLHVVNATCGFQQGEFGSRGSLG